MISKIYTIYDSVAEYYYKIVQYRNRGEAIRAFSEIANDTESSIGRYPTNYVLFELGEYDDSTAHINLHSAPVSCGIASDFVRSGSAINEVRKSA